MESSTRVDIALCSRGTKRTMIYGEALLRHIIADDEAQKTIVVDIEVGHPNSWQVL